MKLRTKNSTTSTAALMAALLLGSTLSTAGGAGYIRHHKEAKTEVSALANVQPEPNTRRVWVRYQKGNHDACLHSIQQATNHKIKVVHDFSHTDSVVITASEAELKALLSDPNVMDVVDDPRRYLIDAPTSDVDPKEKRELIQWEGQATTYGLDLVQASEAWEAGVRGAGVTVCVIDTGLDITHEDFNSAVLSGESMASPYNWTNDFVGHGTHVTGTIAAADNDLGLVGVAPEAHIHMIQGLDEYGYIYSSDLIEAMYHCRDAGAQIISMSLGGWEEIQEEEDVLTELYTDHNILSIASSGNSGWEEYEYPASYPNVVSVGAIDRLENLAYFSTYNDMVDLAAPGLDVWSTLPTNYDCLICQELVRSHYGSISGTSCAVPHVAGAAALLFSYNVSAPVSHIHNALLASAKDLGIPGRDDYYGEGLVKSRDALDVLIATLNGNEPLQCWDEVCPLTCSENEILVTVNLLTDRYGNETNWEVVRGIDNFTVMADAGFGSREASSKSYCLPPNCYTFQINDSYGDGIDGEYGQGNYNVTVDGELIMAGGNFTFSESVSFGGDCVALSTLPKPDLPPFVDLALVLLTDQFPSETSVALADLSTGEVYWTDEEFSLPHTEYTLTQEVDPLNCYSFVITDSFGDGICCYYGDGYFELFYDGVSVHSGSNFGSTDNFLIGESCDNI